MSSELPSIVAMMLLIFFLDDLFLIEYGYDDTEAGWCAAVLLEQDGLRLSLSFDRFWVVVQDAAVKGSVADPFSDLVDCPHFGFLAASTVSLLSVGTEWCWLISGSAMSWQGSLGAQHFRLLTKKHVTL
jgi:hypothetical protein